MRFVPHKKVSQNNLFSLEESQIPLYWIISLYYRLQAIINDIIDSWIMNDDEILRKKNKIFKKYSKFYFSSAFFISVKTKSVYELCQKSNSKSLECFVQGCLSISSLIASII